MSIQTLSDDVLLRVFAWVYGDVSRGEPEGRAVRRACRRWNRVACDGRSWLCLRGWDALYASFTRESTDRVTELRLELTSTVTAPSVTVRPPWWWFPRLRRLTVDIRRHSGRDWGGGDPELPVVLWHWLAPSVTPNLHVCHVYVRDGVDTAIWDRYLVRPLLDVVAPHVLDLVVDVRRRGPLWLGVDADVAEADPVVVVPRLAVLGCHHAMLHGITRLLARYLADCHHLHWDASYGESDALVTLPPRLPATLEHGDVTLRGSEDVVRWWTTALRTHPPRRRLTVRVGYYLVYRAHTSYAALLAHWVALLTDPAVLAVPEWHLELCLFNDAAVDALNVVLRARRHARRAGDVTSLHLSTMGGGAPPRAPREALPLIALTLVGGASASWVVASDWSAWLTQAHPRSIRMDRVALCVAPQTRRVYVDLTMCMHTTEQLRLLGLATLSFCPQANQAWFRLSSHELLFDTFPRIVGVLHAWLTEHRRTLRHVSVDLSFASRLLAIASDLVPDDKAMRMVDGCVTAMGMLLHFVGNPDAPLVPTAHLVLPLLPPVYASQLRPRTTLRGMVRGDREVLDLATDMGVEWRIADSPFV